MQPARLACGLNQRYAKVLGGNYRTNQLMALQGVVKEEEEESTRELLLFVCDIVEVSSRGAVAMTCSSMPLFIAMHVSIRASKIVCLSSTRLILCGFNRGCHIRNARFYAGTRAARARTKPVMQLQTWPGSF